ncbi:hypothetical protein GGI09_007031 [Coemansia sp. S100]|nr:hypothetical protein GGI14_004546 [Coemansia sp. S680]KAJ2084981.1 hypothetical protein GGI09_007031 [Coemansia sp. S100]
MSVSQETPLPWRQLIPLLAMRLSEPIQYAVILPFVYKMIEGFNIAESPKDIAFYASLLFTSFAIAQTLTIMYWSRLSDRIGRRPVLLMGLSGNLVSFLLFSVSTSFYMALGARSLNGLLAGNVAVIKSVLAEISDDTNRARMMALLPLVWNVGSVTGSAIGGIFADPARMFPGVFGGIKIFIMFPYLLPCLIGSTVTLVGLFSGLFVVKETLVKKSVSMVSETTPLIAQKLTTKQLMTPTVTAVMFNNALIGLVIAMSEQTYPIFAATSSDDGGLGLDSRSIGYSLAIAGLAVFYLQLVVYPRLEHRYGALYCYRLGQMLLIPYLLLMPCLSSIAGFGMGLWPALVGLLLVRVTGQVLAFTSINLLTVNLAPTREDLGFMNGAQQLAMSVTRVLGPLIGGLAWSWSLKHGLAYPFNYHFVWVLSAALASFSLYLAQGIPSSVNRFRADK